VSLKSICVQGYNRCADCDGCARTEANSDRHFRINVYLKALWLFDQLFELFVATQNGFIPTDEIVNPMAACYAMSICQKALLWIRWKSESAKGFISIGDGDCATAVVSLLNCTISHQEVMLNGSRNNAIVLAIHMISQNTYSSWCSGNKRRLITKLLLEIVL